MTFLRRGLPRALAHAGIILLTMLWLAPYGWMVMVTFRPPDQAFASGILPERWVLTNLLAIFERPEIAVALRNSLMVAGGAAVLTTFLSTVAGYGFSRYRFRGHSLLLLALLGIKIFPGVLLAISLFLVFTRIGLYDSLLGLVLLNTTVNLPLAIWLMRSFYDHLPDSLDEAALIDGASRLGVIFRVLLPVNLPGIVAVLAFCFLLSWNEYMFATTFILSGHKKVITTVIAEFMGQFTTNYSGLISTAVVATFPLIVMFLLIQRFIIAGLTAGGIKE